MRPPLLLLLRLRHCRQPKGCFQRRTCCQPWYRVRILLHRTWPARATGQRTAQLCRCRARQQSPTIQPGKPFECSEAAHVGIHRRINNSCDSTGNSCVWNGLVTRLCPHPSQSTESTPFDFRKMHCARCYEPSVGGRYGQRAAACAAGIIANFSVTMGRQ